jgi:uncharacterized alkaline shock family protein YloU
MEGHARISTDIVARYAADAAREVAGVTSVRVTGDRERLVVHLHARWGTPLQTLGRDVQQRVAEYLGQMAEVHPATINVVVEEIEGL